MPQIKSRVALPSAIICEQTRGFQEKMASLLKEHAGIRLWRLLQFDILRAYLDGQRRYIALHTELLCLIKSDHALRLSLHEEALKLFAALSDFYVVVRSIGSQIAAMEAAPPE